METSGRRAKAGAALAVTMIAALAFVAGSWTAWREAFPFDPVLRHAFIGLQAMWVQTLAPKRRFQSDVWMRAPEAEPGVVAHEPAKAAAGYTLMTVAQSALMVDMDGTVVHRWSVPYERIEAAGGHPGTHLPDTWIYWQPARVFPNGDLIAVVSAWETTPVGLALIKVDRHSRLLWVYPGHVHHDFDLDGSGNIYVLDQSLREKRPAGLDKLKEPLLDESVVVLSPEGRELDRVSILEAFARSDYRELVNEVAPANVRRWGDYLHTNNVDLVTDDLVGAFDFLQAGQVVLSMRQLDTVAALDLESGKIVWALRGPWHLQHDPDLLENGRILLFDNQGDWARGGHSRVIEFDPRTGGIHWAYPTSEDGELWTNYRGEQQRLPNGNVLINEFLQGRLLEVTRDGETVWEFVTPFRHERHEGYAARIMFAERYPRHGLAFLSADGSRAPGTADSARR